MNRRKLTSLIVIAGGMALTSTLMFNCAPSLFQANSGGSLNLASSLPPEVDASRSPIALMSVNELFHSMANVTAQTNQVPDDMRAEFGTRAGALADNPFVTSVNPPLQLAATALAGEACNGVIAREAASAADARRFFRGINFAAGPAEQSAEAIQDAVIAMAQAFWGRGPTADEVAQLRQFAADLPEGASAAQTRAVVLGTCTAMLASFDAITY